MTLVRCARCDLPICVRCMVDTPVGKKCRSCALTRTHLSESTPGQVIAAYLGGVVAAVPGAMLVGQLPIFILAFPFGALVGEVAWRAGRRSRSLAVQVAGGLAVLTGMVAARWLEPGMGVGNGVWSALDVLVLGVGIAVAVGRIRFV